MKNDLLVRRLIVPVGNRHVEPAYTLVFVGEYSTLDS